MTQNQTCYCSSGKNFSACCKPLLRGESAVSPEALMRSRFCAYAIKDIDYLMATTDPQTRLTCDIDATRDWAEKATFLALEILRSSEDGNKGVVEFKAHFQMPGEEKLIHHEMSKFRKQAGRWYFREGKVFT